MIIPGRAVASGYIEWFYENVKPFIMTPKARARVLRAPRQGLAAEGASTEPYTPLPLVFSHASSSQFQSPMAPPTEGFFIGAFQPYNSMMTAHLHSLGRFFSPTHQ
ncbi:hypothetical protein V6N13_074861 [Hibiscus sabdariffa]